MKVEKIVIASRNEAKIQRFRRLLSGLAIAVVGLDELRVVGKPEETGKTAEENAEIKARFYAEAAGVAVLTEDESLYADFLPENKQPGVYVRRIEGRNEVSDQELLDYWAALVAAAPADKRTGHWHIAYCVATPDGRVETAALDHPIRFYSPPSEVRLRGWPMSSLQGPAMFDKPDSELTAEERKQKDERADRMIQEKLRKIFSLHTYEV